MSAARRGDLAGMAHTAILAAILTALPLVSLAQKSPASSSGSAPTVTGSMSGMDDSGVDQDSVPRMTMPMSAASGTAGQASGARPETTAGAGSGTDHKQHGSMPGTGHALAPPRGALAGMSMDSMQGGGAPTGARSADYSDGVGYGERKPHMHGDHATGMLLFDQLEAVDGRDGNSQSFELSGWHGGDENKLWLRSEGDVSHGKIEDGDVEVFWNHAIATYWGTQLGVRHDLGAGPARNWLAFGAEGLAPYWFTIEATAYVGESGRTAARLRANHEVLFTQRLILEPELEFNLHGRDDPARRIGSGLSDASLGLRLRYEIRREIAPYVGINWVRRVGTTANYARADGQHVFDQQLVAGIRIWF